MNALPNAKELLAARGYDADWFCNALCENRHQPLYTSMETCKIPVTYDKGLYKQRHKIKIMFGGIKKLVAY